MLKKTDEMVPRGVPKTKTKGKKYISGVSTSQVPQLTYLKVTPQIGMENLTRSGLEGLAFRKYIFIT